MKLEEWHLNESDGFEERHLAGAYVPILEAFRSEEEPDRIERLRRVYGLAQHLFLMVEGRRLPRNVVVALHDRKGQLAVTFVDRDWQEFLSLFFQLAWRSEGEPSEGVSCTVQQ